MYQSAGGIGDGLQGLGATYGLKLQLVNTPIYYYVSPTAMPFVSMFHGYDYLGVCPYSNRMSTGHTHVRQMNAGYKNASELPGRWERYAYNVGSWWGWVKPPLCEPDMIKEFSTVKNLVILCPIATSEMRTWPIEHWLELERLLNARGMKTAVLHNVMTKDTLKFRQSLMMLGCNPLKIAGHMLASKLVISNDSGMAHLAGMLDVPLVVVGNIDWIDIDTIYGCYPKYVGVKGPIEFIEPERVLHNATVFISNADV